MFFKKTAGLGDHKIFDNWAEFLNLYNDNLFGNYSKRRGDFQSLKQILTELFSIYYL